VSRFVPIVAVFHNGPLDGQTVSMTEAAVAMRIREHPDGRYVLDTERPQLVGGVAHGDWWWIVPAQVLA
jgi:hypothetical protein